ncbi:FAD-dependent oxidoreductase [Candidatus Latescibacterota bacterium]
MTKIVLTPIVAVLLSFVLLGCDGQKDAINLLIEAESFDSTGTWVVDSQFMDQMGSPFLLAHGLGKPVKDAVVDIEIPSTGTYYVWVRTRNWTGQWDTQDAPGKFQLLLNGIPLATVLGTEGNEWHWQLCDSVNINNSKVSLSLHDLTGFEGRCDAIFFTKDKEFSPPDNGSELVDFRRAELGLPNVPEDAGTYDLVVVGGGIAGTSAAVSAARLGLKVALIQNRPVLGGNNSSEIRVNLEGKTNLAPYTALGAVVNELDPGQTGSGKPASEYNDAKKLRVVMEESNIDLYLNMHVNKVETQDHKLTAVIGKHTRNGRELRFTAPLFSDCTGDGSIGFLAGADYRLGREGKETSGEGFAPDKPDKQVMGATLHWYSVDTGSPTAFPECPWAVNFTEESMQNAIRSIWNWETGMNHDMITEFEYIRDYKFRVIYGNWAFQKNHSKDREKYVNLKLEWMAYIMGKRESRRLLGDVILQQQDIDELREFPDASVTTMWGIDLHYPDPENTRHFPAEEFRGIAVHDRDVPEYPIPYRCFYSRNINNLFMAGRNISVTHVALGTIRVMRTTGMMGEVVGMAATLCNKHNTNPRGVYQNHLDELKELMKTGVAKK